MIILKLIKTPLLIYLYIFLFSDRVGADITVLREREVDYDSNVPRKIAEVLIRKVPDDQQVSRATVKACCFLIVVLLLLMSSLFFFFKSLLILCVFPAVLGPASSCTG